MDLKLVERKINYEILLQDTLSKEKRLFKEMEEGKVGMYNCGPTVYEFPHIGNLRAYVFSDVLRRMFEYNGREVTQVINITDVGHLVGDMDDGDDKVEVAVKKSGLSAKDIIDFYTQAFFDDLKTLNINTADTIFPKATEHIKDQIDFIKTLEKKGFTYKTSDGIYFDTSKLSDYGKLARLDVDGLKGGARVEYSSEKKNITDFGLWKFSKKDAKRRQEWESPWGVGFPGWHIECSAMSMKYLGKQFDIHTGGIDHIPVHHTNEIAQSESLTGKPFVKYWMHNNFVNVNGEKMSKSIGNIITLKNLKENGVSPIAYRYWLLTAHYSTLVNFTYEAVRGVATALDKLRMHIMKYPNNGFINEKYRDKFNLHINNDLDTPKAIALMWELIKDESVPTLDKKATIIDFDKVFGLNLITTENEEKDTIPEEVLILAKKRERERASLNWTESDKIRDEIENLGYEVKDTDSGSKISKMM